MGTEAIFDDEVYFKGKTFVACFTSKKHNAHAKLYLENGDEDPAFFFNWLTETEESFEKEFGVKFILTYANIL